MMEKTNTLRGLATLNFFAADHTAATKWYTNLLGFPPYFERPGYMQFRIGDFQHELGILMPDMLLTEQLHQEERSCTGM